MNIVANAFSLNMLRLDDGPEGLIITPVSAQFVQNEVAAGFRSIVGHADTAALFSNLLGVEVKFNRESFVLDPEMVLFVGQYKGPRLPEGASTLPEGARVEWVMVTME